MTGDLKVVFEGDTTLELFNNSSGYEGWNAVAYHGTGSNFLIAQGGGTVVLFKDSLDMRSK